MRAIQYTKSIFRYLTVRALSRKAPSICTSSLGCIRMVEMDEPECPAEHWLKVKPLLTGICGSDLATIRAEGSPYFSPLTSTPFVLGHEVVGVVTRGVQSGVGFPEGTRVAIEPALGCAVRGITPQCAQCRRGNYANCENVTKGLIAPGIQTGYCRDTGGGWSECLVAHAIQLHVIPEDLSNDLAVLVEPFSCAIHAALSIQPLASDRGSDERSQRTILIIGCGSMGLLTIAALRALGNRDRIIAIGKYEHQAAHAQRLGADEVIQFDEQFYQQLSEMLKAELHFPEVGMPTVVGGVDITFDCVGSSSTIDDALRFTRAHGTVVMVGMPSIPKGVDWTTIWYKELNVRGAYTYGYEELNGHRERTFEIAIRLLRESGDSLRPIVTHRFGLSEYRKAIQTALHAGSSESVKTIFEIG